MGTRRTQKKQSARDSCFFSHAPTLSWHPSISTLSTGPNSLSSNAANAAARGEVTAAVQKRKQRSRNVTSDIYALRNLAEKDKKALGKFYKTRFVKTLWKPCAEVCVGWQGLQVAHVCRDICGKVMAPCVCRCGVVVWEWPFLLFMWCGQGAGWVGALSAAHGVGKKPSMLCVEECWVEQDLSCIGKPPVWCAAMSTLHHNEEASLEFPGKQCT